MKRKAMMSLILAALLTLALSAGAPAAQVRGVTDTTIKIGQ